MNILKQLEELGFWLVTPTTWARDDGREGEMLFRDDASFRHCKRLPSAWRFRNTVLLMPGYRKTVLIIIRALLD